LTNPFCASINSFLALILANEREDTFVSFGVWLVLVVGCWFSVGISSITSTFGSIISSGTTAVLLVLETFSTIE
jgi:branched-subunit amino acid transport protein AzlD